LTKYYCNTTSSLGDLALWYQLTALSKTSASELELKQGKSIICSDNLR
jgi:hypothetical protein